MKKVATWQFATKADRSIEPCYFERNRYRYSLSAVAWALALWACAQLMAAQVRERTSTAKMRQWDPDSQTNAVIGVAESVSLVPRQRDAVEGLRGPARMFA